MNIRDSKPDDIHAMARVYLETWRATYRGILPTAYLDAMTAGETAASLRREIGAAGVMSLIAAVEDGQTAGLITGGIDRRRDLIYSGEIFSLYVHPTFQRQGIGLALVSHLVERMNRVDIFSVKVQVLEANPYRRFYEKLNGVLLACGRIRFADTDLAACTYGWLDTDLMGMIL